MLTTNSGNSRSRQFTVSNGQRVTTQYTHNRITNNHTSSDMQQVYQQMHSNGDDQLVIPDFLPGEAAELDKLYGEDLFTF